MFVAVMMRQLLMINGDCGQSHHLQRKFHRVNESTLYAEFARILQCVLKNHLLIDLKDSHNAVTANGMLHY